MTAQIHTWENRLLAWAYEALESHMPHPAPITSHDSLPAAYRYCRDLTRLHSRTFFLASALLPPEKRQAVRALYGFCRITDNIVDESASATAARTRLEHWRQALMTPDPPPGMPVALAWADTVRRYHIPRGYIEQLIDGVGRDLDQQRYATFAELAEYSYGVASTVGLMAMHIIGFRSAEALPYAVKLGVALQLTNILRDVAEDWRNGRLYLPQDELAAYGLTEADIEAGCVDERWRAFMAHQIARNRRLYDESWPGIALLDADGRFAIGTAAELYRAILADIEAQDYDVFSRRASTTPSGKLRRLPRIWWRSRRAD
ncbi:MAG: phytoene/squalene synthase family protein [Anaerolineae bacterium]|nr:phytoene/squalene synthase family protein [Anaerolineae bacterium]